MRRHGLRRSSTSASAQPSKTCACRLVRGATKCSWACFPLPSWSARAKRSRSFGATSSSGSIFLKPVHSRPCANCSSAYVRRDSGSCSPHQEKADDVARYKEVAGIAALIDADTSSDDAERSKPFPDIFEAALKQLPGLNPSDAVVVGDTPYDAEAARTAGMKTVGVLCGGFAEDALRSAGCVAVYRDPEDLLQNYERSLLAA